MVVLIALPLSLRIALKVPDVQYNVGMYMVH